MKKGILLTIFSLIFGGSALAQQDSVKTSPKEQKALESISKAEKIREIAQEKVKQILKDIESRNQAIIDYQGGLIRSNKFPKKLVKEYSRAALKLTEAESELSYLRGKYRYNYVRKPEIKMQKKVEKQNKKLSTTNKQELSNR